MSLSTDVLSKATPTRLTCRAGRWVLELTRLEAIERDVFQPRLTRLEGVDSILAALRRTEEGQLLAGSAAQIMRSLRGDEDRVFEVGEGDWVATADTGSAVRLESTAEVAEGDAARAILEMRAELAVLRASHARLRDRVMALEAAQNGLPQPGLRPARASRSQRRRSEPPAPLQPASAGPAAPLERPGFTATQASPALRAAPAQPGDAPSAPPVVDSPVAPASAAPAQRPPADGAHQSSAGPSFDDLARAVAGEQPLPVLSLPTQASLGECLEMLTGSALPLNRVESIAFNSLDRPHACKLLDDEGRERGVILFDLKAAVLLGAALLSVPQEEALRQIREDDVSEDALLAMSEVCNNLTGPVNSAAGNEHVRSTALAAIDVTSLPRPRARLDLSYAGGSLVLAMF